MKLKLVALIATLSIAGASAQAKEVFLTKDNLRDFKKLAATTATVAEGVEFVAGCQTGSNKQSSTLKNISDYSSELYKILSAALEEGELLVKVRDIVFKPMNKARNDRGIFNWPSKEDVYNEKTKEIDKDVEVHHMKELRKGFVEMFKAFAKEVAHSTTGKVAENFFEGKEKRIYRRATNMIVNPICDALIVLVVDYLNRCLVSWYPSECNWGWKSNLEQTWGKCWKEVTTSFKKEIFYEVLGEFLIRAAEGEEDKVDLVKVLGLEKVAAYKKEDILRLFGRKVEEKTDE